MVGLPRPRWPRPLLAVLVVGLMAAVVAVPLVSVGEGSTTLRSTPLGSGGPVGNPLSSTPRFPYSPPTQGPAAPRSAHGFPPVPSAAGPVVRVGPEVPVSWSLPGSNAEVEEAVDPVTHYLYVEWIAQGGIGFSRSTNGGASFGPATLLPGSLDYFDPTSGNYSSSWDPALVTTSSGTIYAAFMHSNWTNLPGGAPVVDASFDHGASFPTSSVVNQTSPSSFSDRDFIAVGPSGDIYVTWDYAPVASEIGFLCSPTGSCGYSAGDLNVVFERSSDGGAHWSSMVPISPGFPLGGADSAPLVVQPNGRIDVLYQGYSTNATTFALTDGHEYFTASTDGGQHWSPPILVGLAKYAMNDGEWWIDGDLALGSGGTLYATYDSQLPGGDIGWLLYSTDGGSHWSAPIRVASAPSTAHIVQVAAGPYGTADIGWLANNSAQAGWSAYLSVFRLSTHSLSSATRVSSYVGLGPVWPGDTIGLVSFGAGSVAMSWGVGLDAAGEPTDNIMHVVLHISNDPDPAAAGPAPEIPVSWSLAPYFNAEVIEAVDPVTHALYAAWIAEDGIGFARSTDGGASFGPARIVPGSATFFNFSSGSYQQSWDPSLATSPGGALYVGFMYSLNGSSEGTPVVAVSYDHGTTFSRSVSVMASPPTNSFSDRDYLTVGARGALYVTWDFAPNESEIQFICSPTGSCAYSNGDFNIVIARSVDQGRSWSAMTPVTPGYPYGGGFSGPIVAGSDGSLYILYWGHALVDPTTFALGPGQEYFVRSSDNGRTWSLPILLSGPYTVALPTWWIDGDIAIATDGTLYVTFDGQTPTSDIGFLRYSTDGGRSWSPLIRVTPDHDAAAHIVQVVPGPSGVAYIGWITNRSTAGWSGYLSAFHLHSHRLSAPIEVSTYYGLANVWPGDTIGLAYLGDGRVSMAWGMGLVAAGQFSDTIFNQVV